MDPSQLKFVLEELNFSADLPPDVLDHLAARAVVRRLPAGTVAFREGSQCEDFYLVRSGRLALEMNVPGRGPVRILTLGPGEMFGWSTLLESGKMTATAIAIEDAEVIVSPASGLRELSETNYQFGFHLMRRMAEALSKRLVATRLQLLDLFADTPGAVPTSHLEGGR